LTVTADELKQRREAMNGTGPSSKDKTENVIKFFFDAEKIAAIKAQDTRITIGTPPTPIVIRPMSPKGVAESYVLIRKLVMPLITLINEAREGAPMNLGLMMEAFGENIEILPELLFRIISRGNPDLTRDWCDEHIDFALDAMLIIPIFLEQNGLGKLFSGKAQAALVENPGTPPEQSSKQTEESQAVSTSSADSTDGQQTTLGTT
jgi:hypothetical protein